MHGMLVPHLTVTLTQLVSQFTTRIKRFLPWPLYTFPPNFAQIDGVVFHNPANKRTNDDENKTCFVTS